jgi:hypothetical protein
MKHIIQPRYLFSLLQTHTGSLFLAYTIFVCSPTYASTIQNTLYGWEDTGAPAYQSLRTTIPAAFARSFAYSFQAQASDNFIIGASSNTYYRDLGPAKFLPMSQQYVAGPAALVPTYQSFYTTYAYRLSSIFAIQLSTTACTCSIENYNLNGGTSTASFTIPDVKIPTPGVMTTYLLSVSLTNQACSIRLDYLDTSTPEPTQKTLFTLSHTQLPPAVWELMRTDAFKFTDVGFRMARAGTQNMFMVQNTKLQALNSIDLTLVENVTSAYYPWDDVSSKNITIPIPTECTRAFQLTFRANPQTAGAMGIGLYSKQYCNVTRSSQDGYGYVVKAKECPLASPYPNNFIYTLSAIVEYVIGDALNTKSSLIIEAKENRNSTSPGPGLKLDTSAKNALVPFPGALTQFIYTVITSPKKITISLEYIAPNATQQQEVIKQEIMKVTETQFGYKSDVADYIRSTQFTGFTDIGFIAGAPFTVKDISIGLPAAFIDANTRIKNARAALSAALLSAQTADAKAQEVVAAAEQLASSHENKALFQTEATLLRTGNTTNPPSGTQAQIQLITQQLALYPETPPMYDSIEAAIAMQKQAEDARNTALEITNSEQKTLATIAATLQKIITAANTQTSTSLENTRTTLTTLQSAGLQVDARLETMSRDITALSESIPTKAALTAQAKTLKNNTTVTPATGITATLSALTTALANLPPHTSYTTVADAQNALQRITLTLSSADAITAEITRLDGLVTDLENEISQAETDYQNKLIATAQEKASAEAAAARAAQEKAEAERIAAEKAAADAAAAKMAEEKAEAARIAAEKAAAEAKAGTDKTTTDAATPATTDAEATKVAEEKAAQEKAAADAAAKAAADKAEAARIAAEKAADDAKIATEKAAAADAAAAKIAEEKAAQEKAAAEAAEKAAADKIEVARIAAEKIAADTKAAADAASKVAADQAEAARIAAEQAAQEKAETERIAAAQAAQPKQPASKLDEALARAQTGSIAANTLVEKSKKLPNSRAAQALKNTAQSLKANFDDIVRKLVQAQKSLSAPATRTLSAAKIQSNVRTIENYAKTALALIKQRTTTLTATQQKIDAIIGAA